MKQNFWPIIKNHRFLKIWLAQILSSTSAYTLNFLLIGLIFKRTQSTVAVSLLLLLFYLPTVFLSPLIGIFIDSLNKRKIFIYSNLSQALIVPFYLLAREKIWLAYAVVFIYSLCDELFNPAINAVLPDLVEKKDLTAANSLLLLTAQLAVVIGMIIGGLSLKLFQHENLGFLIAAMMLLLAAGLSAKLPKGSFYQAKKINFLKTFTHFHFFWEQYKQGYQFIKSEPLVLFPILLLSGIQTFLVITMMLLPALASILKISFADSSFLIIGPAILGAFLGTALVGKTSIKIRKNLFVLGGLGLMGLSTALLAIIPAWWQKPILPAMPLILIIGLSYIAILTPLKTIIHELTPFNIRGRVFAALNTATHTASVLPLLAAAGLIDILGLQGVLIGTGFLAIFLAIFGQRKKAILLNQKS